MSLKIANKLVVAGCLAVAGLSATVHAQPDVTQCQLYDLKMVFSGQAAREGDTVGFSAATTSWNIGTEQLIWEQSPDWDHPFIVINMYRLKDGRFSHIGQSWIKHGFFALSSSQCTTTCQPTNGTRLGVGCTDTYTSNLNASQGGLGPRYEVNPWNGQWNYQGSVFQAGGVTNNKVTRRLQVKDADLDPALNPGASYFIESYYVCKDDMNVMNSAGWRPATITSGSSGTTYAMTPGSGSSNVVPNVGFAIDAWTGARQTMIAQELPIVENIASNPVETWSPDGRSILASKVTDNGNGTWRYEYAILNIDMDRQIQSFIVPTPSGVEITNVGSSAVLHHNEPYAWSDVTGFNPSTGTGGVRTHGKVIDNTNWTGTWTEDQFVRWDTPDVTSVTPSNPIRWGTIRNFWFDASTAPSDGIATVGLFKLGPVMTVDGLTDVPTAVPPPPFCFGDANNDGMIDFDDISEVIANWGAQYKAGSAGAGDANNDGSVDFDDISEVIANWGSGCK